MWDTIVIGSGIGGLAAAAALAKVGQRVLVLEQHHTAGGLTQVFMRKGWTFATGVHYLAGVGPQPGTAGQFGRLLDWLGDGALRFASCGNPYDIIRMPGFEFGIHHPESTYRDALLARFPDQHPAIGRWFDEMHGARKVASSMMALRGMPAWLAWGLRLWRGADIEHLSQRTVAQALAEVADPHLRAVLAARWGDHGAPPESAPLIEHALVTGAYDGGSYYPVGGPARFAHALLAPVLAAGGEIRLNACVERIRVEAGRAVGVSYRQYGVPFSASAQHSISAMGALNTVNSLDLRVATAWREQVQSFRPGLAGLCLYLGLEGDIAAAGASAANVWIYDSPDVGRVWQVPAEQDAPGLFVSFPSLKDPAYTGQPTAEVLAICDAGTFSPWLHLPEDDRPKDYLALKASIQQRLLGQFERHFPALAPLVRYEELSTPLTQQTFVRTPAGAMYGLEMDARRMGSDALNVRTPVPGLLLAGQDVFGAGVPAAAMSGALAAAAVAPGVWRHLGG